MKTNLCANGLSGFNTETGREYFLSKDRLCKNRCAAGHTFCDPCREEAGGYWKDSPSKKGVCTGV